MHLIFSEYIDFSSNRVIDWLIYYDQKYQKYIGQPKTGDHFRFDNKIITACFGGTDDEESFMIKDNNQEIDFESVWFRRPVHNTNSFLFDIEHNYKGSYPKGLLVDTIHKREKVLWDFLGYKLKEKHHQGSFEVVELNKPIILKKAQSLGLTIPKTLITNSRQDLEIFFKNCNNKIITKSLGSVIPGYEQKPQDMNYLSFYQLTKLIDNLENTPKLFAPSLFQEYVDKEYEIRTIFLKGKLYSASIFSQLNEHTKVDMRNRSANHPTRYIPYQLDKKIEISLIKLMKKLNLDYGAIDIVKGIDGRYYFLEINPVGQYGDVSLQCNYYLNKIIAEDLIKNFNDDRSI